MTKLYRKKDLLLVIVLLFCISSLAVNSYAQACPPPSRLSTNQSLNIKADSPVYKQLEEVIVVGYNKRKIECGWSIVELQGKKVVNLGSGEGILLLCKFPGVYVTTSNYVNDSIKPVVRKPDIKLYPNPTLAGATVNFKFKNEIIGNYKIEIVDVSGRIIQTQYVSILLKDQVISFSTSSAWTKGVYLVRISGKNSTNVEIGKLTVN